jgi:hypothetical protein
MTATPAGFDTITGPIVETVTSTAAVAAYVTVMICGVSVGVIVKMWPRVFNHVDKFLPWWQWDYADADYALIPMDERFFWQGEYDSDGMPMIDRPGHMIPEL